MDNPIQSNPDVQHTPREKKNQRNCANRNTSLVHRSMNLSFYHENIYIQDAPQNPVTPHPCFPNPLLRKSMHKLDHSTIYRIIARLVSINQGERTKEEKTQDTQKHPLTHSLTKTNTRVILFDTRNLPLLW